MQLHADPRDESRSHLWVVAFVCFGPLTLTWLLGLLMTPMWIGMLIALLAKPERFAHDPGATPGVVGLPIGLVIAGLIGLVGLVRVLTLPPERPESHRLYTIGMVAVGLAALLVFHFADGGSAPLAEVLTVSGVLYLVLPLTGAAWLLARSWRFLLASRAPRAP